MERSTTLAFETLKGLQTKISNISGELGFDTPRAKAAGILGS